MSCLLLFDGDVTAFDVVLSERSEFTATATEHPVEAGSDVTDHVRDKLTRFTVTGVVSNTPIKDVNGNYNATLTNVPLIPPANISPPPKPSLLTPGGLTQAASVGVEGLLSGFVTTPAATVLTFGASPFNAIKDVLDRLTRYKENAIIGSVLLRSGAAADGDASEYKMHKSVCIERITVTRVPKDGNAATFEVEFREIRLVATSLVNAPKPTIISATKSVPKGQQNPTPADTGKSNNASALLVGFQKAGVVH